MGTFLPLVNQYRATVHSSITADALKNSFRKQAKEATKKLKGEKFDLIICSPLKRAKKTAEIINEELKLEIVYENNLREQHYGDWGGKYSEDLMKDYDTDIDGLRQITAPNGEPFESVVKRVGSIVAKYRDKKVLIVAHGHVYFAALCYTQGKVLSEVMDEPHDNATHSLRFFRYT